MPLTDAPVLYGRTLRRPQQRTRTPEPLASTVTLAAGGLRRYSRGRRYRWSLSWVNLPEAEAIELDEVLSRTGALSFVDQDGISYVVMVEGYGGLEAKSGTSPVRYDASADLVQQGTIR